ncbi:MAG: bifunctional oligoribonuclease/PAP phosphatase NrnA [Firmicutes bacterium]|nr:bifunctional oligoribonuclease/PAP phosphatase NrnA [Bacillota bacterium]
MKIMYRKIYKAIKKHSNIVIARHIGVDPDALASQLALKEAIELTFPKKKVYAVGNGSTKFSYIGKLDKLDESIPDGTLLIVLDTPDARRVDCPNITAFSYKIKIDHHPFVEKFCDLEFIDDTTSSTCQLIMELLYKTKLKKNKSIMEKLFLGLVSDTNRFLFNAKSNTFSLMAKVLKDYDLDLPDLYQSLYMRPFNEFQLQGYISQNMKVTEHGVGYIVLTSDILNKFDADAGSAGNMVNNFNYIDELLVWCTVSEDKKNDILKVNIRSRGPVINTVAEKYNGGGHKFASGARITSLEEVQFLINDLDRECNKYMFDKVGEENEDN